MATELFTEKAISLPFRFTPQGNVAVETSQEKIWSNRVRAAVGTIMGERPMRSDYGLRLETISFETIGSIEIEVKDELSRMFGAMFPTLTLIDVSTSYDSQAETAIIDVVYSLPNKDTTSIQVGVATISNSLPIREESK
jgi:phage baseplate assembly protein W